MYKRHQNLVKIGKKIREIRSSCGYSQESFAAEAGLARTYMGRVERGEQNMSLQILIKIAFTLNIDPSNLLPPLRQLKNPE